MCAWYAWTGIGPAGEKILIKNGIKTAKHLVGQFWLHDCDEAKFKQFLLDLGILDTHAKECADKMFRRFGGLF